MLRTSLTFSEYLVRTCLNWPKNLKGHSWLVWNKSPNMANVKVLVDSKISGKKVMVFSKSTCPFCTKAKNVFSRLVAEGKLSSDDYEVMEIENNNDCQAIQDYLQSVTGARSVPRVFINGRCIGGGDDVVKADKSGQLLKQLA